MKTSCVQHPAREPLIIIRKWQIEFCDGDKCAAALLSFFEYWHNIKLEQSKKAQQANDIAEIHGDKRSQDESLIQFHSTQELKDGIMGLYAEKTIRQSLALLKSKGAIEIMRNPNPKYAFDKTRYFLFNPDACNDFLKTRCGKNATSNGKNAVRCGKNAVRCGKNADGETVFSAVSADVPAVSNVGEITTETTTETTSNANPMPKSASTQEKIPDELNVCGFRITSSSGMSELIEVYKMASKRDDATKALNAILLRILIKLGITVRKKDGAINWALVQEFRNFGDKKLLAAVWSMHAAKETTVIKNPVAYLTAILKGGKHDE